MQHILVVVRPQSGRQEIIANDTHYTVFVKSPARDGKANKEMLTLLKKYFKNSISGIRIVSGKLSSRKIVELTLP